eukprot:scaffold22585_cov149-Cylindrotheca_fusiformis.AAC.10
MRLDDMIPNGTSALSELVGCVRKISQVEPKAAEATSRNVYRGWSSRGSNLVEPMQWWPCYKDIKRDQRQKDF